MKLVRLFLLQDNKRWHIDVPYGQHLETVADLEIQGIEIYHASLLEPVKKRRVPARRRYT